MRVAIVSDTHGEMDRRVADAIVGCDLVVHAGDIGAHSVLEALGAGGASVVAVRGNNDVPAKWPVGDRPFLEAIPWEHDVSLPGGRLAVVHGHRCARPSIRHDRLRRAYPSARAVVYGHSHRRCVDTDATPWVLNPGASGRVRTFGGASWLLLDARDEGWRVDPVCYGPA